MVDRLECVSGLPTADESDTKPGAYVSLRVEKGTHLVCACSDQPVLDVVPLLAGLRICGDVRLVSVLQVRRRIATTRQTAVVCLSGGIIQTATAVTGAKACPRRRVSLTESARRCAGEVVFLYLGRTLRDSSCLFLRRFFPPK